MKAIVGAAMLIAVATGVVACSNGGAAPTLSGNQPGNPAALGAPSPSYPPGVPVTTLTCDDFPISLIQSAAQQVVPSVATVQLPPSSGDSSSPTDTGSGLACHYQVGTAGTDMAAANHGMVSIGFTLGDQVKEPEVPNDSVISYAQEKADFADAKKTAKAQDNGQPQDDEKPQYRDTPTQVGDGSYVVDEPHFQSDGTQTDYTMDLWVLHLPRPTSLDVTMGFYMAGISDSPPPDAALDNAMRDDNQRVQLAMAIAKAVLSKIPTTASH